MSLLVSIKRFLGITTGPVARAHIIVKGRVTDGAFHIAAGKYAQSVGLRGYLKVKDAFSSNPYLDIEVEGGQVDMKNFILELRTGRNTHISNVSVEWLTADRQYHKTFTIFS